MSSPVYNLGDRSQSRMSQRQCRGEHTGIYTNACARQAAVSSSGKPMGESARIFVQFVAMTSSMTLSQSVSILRAIIMCKQTQSVICFQHSRVIVSKSSHAFQTPLTMAGNPAHRPHSHSGSRLTQSKS